MIEGIETQIERNKRRKTIGLEIHPGPILRVLSPSFLTDEQLEDALSGKKQWIYEKVGLIEKVSDSSAKEFVSGESFSLIGRDYRLKVLKDISAPVAVKDNQIIVSVPSSVRASESEDYVKEVLINWYKDQAHKKLSEVLKRYEKAFGVSASKFGVKNYKSSWGRCSEKGEIFINWRIIMAPISIINYVVAHEVCHLIYPDHSDLFWKSLSFHVSEVEEKREWLVVNKDKLLF